MGASGAASLYGELVQTALAADLERRPVSDDTLHDPAWRADNSRAGRLIVTDSTAYQERERWKAQTPAAWPVPDGELAKRYLGWCFSEGETHRSKVPFAKRSLEAAIMTPPQYFPGYTADRLADYVDIVSAFQQIRLPHSLDLRFDPARGRVADGRIRFLRATEILEDKRLARPLTGYVLPARLNVISKGETIRTPKKLYNKFEAPELVSYTYYMLHYVMYEAVRRYGILYGNTDGYIVGREHTEDLIRWLKREWSLDARIKATGIAEVKSANRYQIRGANPETSHTIEPEAWKATPATGPYMSVAGLTPGLPDYLPDLATTIKRHRYIAVEQGMS